MTCEAISTCSDGPPRWRAGRGGGFTLVELLVVMSIIVLILAMSLPMFRAMTGSRSVEAAHNKVSAMLQHARSVAIGLQERRGVLFFNDAAAGKVAMVVVRVVDAPTTANPTTAAYPLELDEANPQAEYLPPGVGAAFYRQVQPTGGGDPTVVGRVNGLVLFDGQGRLQHLNGRLFAGSAYNLNKAYQAQWDGGTGPLDEWSSQQIMLYDRNAMASLAASGSPTDYSPEQLEWLNRNASLLVISRYNGTIIKGE